MSNKCQYSLAEVARLLDINRETVRKMEKKALAKLTEQLKYLGYKASDFL